jgi:2'-5' RNA ligase
VSGDERLRLFVGYPVPESLRPALVAWSEELFAGAGRVVPAGNLHLTVAFLGSTPAGRVDDVRGIVHEAARGRPRPRFAAERVRLTRSVGMLVLRDVDGSGTALATETQRLLAAAGVYEPEARPWLPHVTVVRWKERPTLVRTYVPVMEIVPSEIVVYLSVLRAGGAQYEPLHSAALGG